MFDIKSFFKREVEKTLTNVDDYIFMPERVEMFETELYHGVYDDVINDLTKEVSKILDGKSEYFRQNKTLPATASLMAKPSNIDRLD